MSDDVRDRVISFLAFVGFFMMICCVLLVLIIATQQDEINSIPIACDDTGQFTVSGRTYRCGAVTQEALDAAYNRQFERCRQWLHNPVRGREMPLVRNDNE